MCVIGKAKKPRCFKNVKNLPCTYRSQKKSWMDAEIFSSWVKQLDRKFTLVNRKIALLIDNCRAHPTEIPNLSSIEIIFLPPNTTSKLQPMDQGVIRSLKAHYRTKLVRKFLTDIELKRELTRISLIDAMNYLVQSWEIVSKETITNCFKKAGISENSQLSAVNDDDNPFKDLETEWKDLQCKRPEMIPADIKVEDFIDVDKDTATSESLPSSDEEILQPYLEGPAVHEDGVEDDDDNEEMEAPVKPTKAEIREAMNLLQTWTLFSEESLGASMRQNLSKFNRDLERSLVGSTKQMTIDKFFTAEH